MRKWNKHMCITSWTEKKWMEWSLFYTETQSTARVFEGNLQTLNWKNELLMLKSGLMLSVAETWGKNKNTEYWHENENFTSAMYTCHIFETDLPFSPQITWNELEKHSENAGLRQAGHSSCPLARSLDPLIIFAVWAYFCTRSGLLGLVTLCLILGRLPHIIVSWNLHSF